MKNFFFLLLIGFLVIGHSLTAQQISIDWDIPFGGTDLDLANEVQQTSDGGFIIAGTAASNDGDVTGVQGMIDFWVIKTDADGNLEWQRTLGGTLDENATSIQQTSDGGYILAGYTRSNNGDVSGNHGIYDYWVVKLTSTGIISWQKTYGGNNEDFGESIRQTSDGGYIVAGYSNSFNCGGPIQCNDDFWILKLDPSGNVTWQKTFGGSEAEQPFSIRQTSDGGYVATGYSNSNNGNVSGNHGGDDIWVIKLDGSGTLVWQKCLGGSQGELAREIQQTTDGGYIVAGSTGSNDGDVTGIKGNANGWVVKLNASGNISWQKTYGGKYTWLIESIQQTSEGGYVFSGSSTEHVINQGLQEFFDFWVVKTDDKGKISWQKEFGGPGSDVAQCVRQTSDGGYIVTGYINAGDGGVEEYLGKNDVWLVKLGDSSDSDGPCSGRKVQVCHNGHTICVDENAVPAHLDHGDQLGSCGNQNEIQHIDNADEVTQAFNVYPNTSHGDFILKVDSGQSQTNQNLQVVDMKGRIIREIQLVSDEEYDLHLDVNGVYFVRMISGQEMVTKKIVVMK